MNREIKMGIRNTMIRLVPSFIQMHVLGMDTAWANGPLDGTREDPPANIAAETKERLRRAQGGCK